MKRRSILLPLALLASAAPAERVFLRGGGRIEAPRIAEDEHRVVLDLGFDLLRVPRSEILRIEGLPAGAASGEPGPASGLYRAEDRPVTPTAKAAEEFGPAVVVVRSPAGLGSGFFISRDGHLVSNFHVIAGQKSITVTRQARQDGVPRRVVHRAVEIVAVAPFQDLAVLRVLDLDEAVVPVVFAPEADRRVGETVFAIGNPLGLEQTLTEGVLSQTARNFNGLVFLQVDAPVNPGNSGGPLFNHRGQVIGVINMKIPTMEGLNFAIPIGQVRYVLDHLEAFAYDETNSESGFFYPAPPGRPAVRLRPTDNQGKEPRP